jgi:3-deoxy-D-manno-octulosonic-acid transferase
MSRPLLSVYGLLARAAQPLLRRKLRRRGAAEPGYLEAVDERFGRYAAPARPGALWIHAVSLGETRAAAILLQALRARDPGLRVLLTHGTATGRAEGAKLLRPGDAQAWLPWDTPQAVAAFLAHFRPSAGVLLETEVWPALVAGCRAAGVPLALVNARLSDKSLRQAQRLAWLSRPAYAGLDLVLAQTEADAQRLRAAGARVAAVTGNLKFDALPDPGQLAQGRAWRAALGRPVLLLASSREGEEAALLQRLAAQPALREGVQWLLVPRHPQRFDAVAQLAREAGLAPLRRSAWPADAPPPAAPLWLGDTLGEMALYYGLADVALLGGSWEPLGGQNLIEAAACGCPVVMGPHTFNFAEAAQQAQESGAAVRAPELDAGLQLALALARAPARHAAAVAAGEAFAQAHRGAAARTAAQVLALAPAPGRVSG